LGKELLQFLAKLAVLFNFSLALGWLATSQSRLPLQPVNLSVNIVFFELNLPQLGQQQANILVNFSLVLGPQTVLQFGLKDVILHLFLILQLCTCFFVALYFGLRFEDAVYLSEVSEGNRGLLAQELFQRFLQEERAGAKAGLFVSHWFRGLLGEALRVGGGRFVDLALDVF